MKLGGWKIPLTLAGLGGVGAVLCSSRGRKLIHTAAEHFSAAPGRLAAWNDAAKQELDHIQRALQELEHSISTHTAK
jgi:hypothetical protein